MTEGIEAVESAYLTLLRIPLKSRLRLYKLQHVLAQLRDVIAEANDIPAEDVQNEFEARAANL